MAFGKSTLPYDTLRLIRNLLLRSFVVGFVIATLLGGIVFIGWQDGMQLASQVFHTDAATLTPLIVEFFLDIRFFLLFILLTPALAIHWTLKKR